jgi:hypothetical protein
MTPQARSGKASKHIGAGSVLIAAALASLAAGTISCRPTRPCAVVPSPSAAPAPRRDHCLAPPWVVDRAHPTAGLDGWSAAACPEGTGTEAYFIHDGTRAISADEVNAVLESVRGLGQTTGLGGCCSPKVAAETKVFCLKFWSNVCRLEMGRVVGLVDEELRRNGLADVRVGVDISVGGRVGPRCEPTDSACGPETRRESEGEAPAPSRNQQACVAGRVPLAARGEATPRRACVHDGECVVAGCGNTCLRWDEEPGPMWCDDIARKDNGPVPYCGCVVERCGWFRPAP